MPLRLIATFTLTIMALATGSQTEDFATFHPDNATNLSSTLPTNHDRFHTQNRSIAELFKETMIQNSENATLLTQSLAKRAYYNYRDGCLLSTTWTVGANHYNVTMLGSTTTSSEVGYYRFLNRTSIQNASLETIWQDVVIPHTRGATLAMHTLDAAREAYSQAIDLINDYIICGQNPASARALLARISSRDRDGFWTVLMAKGTAQFGIAYLLTYFPQNATPISSSEIALAAAAATYFATVSGAIVDRLQQRKRTFSSVEAFLINAFLALQRTTLEGARSLFRNSCLAASSIENGLSEVKVDVVHDIMHSHILPRFTYYLLPDGDAEFSRIGETGLGEAHNALRHSYGAPLICALD